jgi:hypothetical protein
MWDGAVRYVPPPPDFAYRSIRAARSSHALPQYSGDPGMKASNAAQNCERK